MRLLHKLLTVIADRIEKMPLRLHGSVVRLVKLGCLKIMLKNIRKNQKRCIIIMRMRLVPAGGVLPQIFWF